MGGSHSGARVAHLDEDILLRALEYVPHNDEDDEEEQPEVKAGALQLVVLAWRQSHRPRATDRQGGPNREHITNQLYKPGKLLCTTKY